MKEQALLEPITQSQPQIAYIALDEPRTFGHELNLHLQSLEKTVEITSISPSLTTGKNGFS